jgi:Xaa-Pro aminopeptidase
MNRITKLLQLLKEKDVDGFFISSVSNITYLTGFTGDSSRLVITPDRCVLITDGRYTEQATQECPPNIEIFKWMNDKRYATETYNHITKSLGIKRLGFEGNYLTFTEYDTLKTGLTDTAIIALSGTVDNIRQDKDDFEIECLRTACQISDKALELTLPFIKEGITELELSAKLEYNLKTNGSEGLSFETIVLSGAKTSLLHGKPANKKLAVGDLVLFDFGALYKGYHADISRTFVIGSVNAQQQEIYNIIKRAQSEAIKSIMPGVSAKTPDQTVRNIIPQKYIDYYYPGLGHGVGLQIHEEPYLGQAWEFILEKNTTLTVEPGIYIPGWGGIRIEDTVLIKDNGTEHLSNFSRELMIL